MDPVTVILLAAACLGIGAAIGWFAKKIPPPSGLVFQPCPHCAEAIRVTATICYHCHKHVTGPSA